MAEQRVLFVHIGDHKTGSSFLQSCFAASISSLADAGIRYPTAAQIDRAAEGGLSIGNAGPLMKVLNGDNGAGSDLADVCKGDASVLFSGEMLFMTLMRRRGLQKLVEAAKGAGFGRVKLILFIRDPISHCSSLWQQSVKKGGNINPIDRSAQAFSRPILTANFLEQCEAEPDVQLTIQNYSVVRKNLRKPLAHWLGVPEGVLLAPPIATVNRSLTGAELELQLALNEVLGRNLLLAGPLCEQLPELRADDTRPSLAAQRLLWERLGEAVAAVNRRVPPEQGYRCDVASNDGASEQPLSMSAEQLHLIGSVLGSEIARLRIQLEGDLDLLDVYLSASGDTPANRRFVSEYARGLKLAGNKEKAAQVRERLIALSRPAAPDSATSDETKAEPLAKQHQTRLEKLEERRAARRATKRPARPSLDHSAVS